MQFKPYSVILCHLHENSHFRRLNATALALCWSPTFGLIKKFGKDRYHLRRICLFVDSKVFICKLFSISGVQHVYLFLTLTQRGMSGRIRQRNEGTDNRSQTHKHRKFQGKQSDFAYFLLDSAHTRKVTFSECRSSA